jgi:hypothetical protein
VVVPIPSAQMSPVAPSAELFSGANRHVTGGIIIGVVIGMIPRSIRRGRKRPLLIVFDSFGSDHITAVFHRIVNERKRSDTPFSGSLRQLLTVYDMKKNGCNTITTKWAIYTPYTAGNDSMRDGVSLLQRS